MDEQDIFANVVGGLQIEEPAADLAVAVALASGLRDRPLPADLALVGEVGLSGEVRSVGQLEARLNEASRLGFEHVHHPAPAQPFGVPPTGGAADHPGALAARSRARRTGTELIAAQPHESIHYDETVHQHRSRSRSRSSRSKKQQPTLWQQLTRDQKLDILGWVLIVLAVLTILSMLSAQQGVLTQWWIDLLSQLFGWGRYVVPMFLGGFGLWLVLRHFGDKIPTLNPGQVIGLILGFFVILTTLHFAVTRVWPQVDVYALGARGRGRRSDGGLCPGNRHRLAGSRGPDLCTAHRVGGDDHADGQHHTGRGRAADHRLARTAPGRGIGHQGHLTEADAGGAIWRRRTTAIWTRWCWARQPRRRTRPCPRSTARVARAATATS